MYQILILDHFRRQLKSYCKKYRHLKHDVILTLSSFEKNREVDLGRNVYKLRIKSKDIPKGKSKSFRLILLVVEMGKFLVPVCLYFKGDRMNVSKKEINDHLEFIYAELKGIG